MIGELFTDKKTPDEGDVELSWLAFEKKAEVRPLDGKEHVRLLLDCRDVERKFTQTERRYFGQVAVTLQNLLKSPPANWNWQETQGMPIYLGVFENISKGVLRSPKQVEFQRESALFYDNKGMGPDCNVQGVVARTSQLADGFYRFYDNSEGLKWYQGYFDKFIASVS